MDRKKSGNFETAFCFRLTQNKNNVFFSSTLSLTVQFNYVIQRLLNSNRDRKHKNKHEALIDMSYTMLIFPSKMEKIGMPDQMALTNYKSGAFSLSEGEHARAQA